MVSESTIESIIGHYENEEEAYINALSEIMESQPALLAFLNQESVDILLEEEKDILWYIILVIYNSVEKSQSEMVEISDDRLSENEEKNWTLFQDQPRGNFREKITPFFKNYHEEDLLAFVEDTLELEDTSPITSVGREVIFIAVKSVIDTLLPKTF
jgi:hypothetical protein